MNQDGFEERGEDRESKRERYCLGGFGEKGRKVGRIHDSHSGVSGSHLR